MEKMIFTILNFNLSPSKLILIDMSFSSKQSHLWNCPLCFNENKEKVKSLQYLEVNLIGLT